MVHPSLKILMVHPHDLWYDPWTIRIIELARGLQRRGHDVRLCHLPRKERPAHGPLRIHQPDDPPVYDLLPRQQHFIHNYRLLHRLAQDCDILHLQKCFAATALPMLWLSRQLGKPLHYDWDDNETAISRKVEKHFLSRWQLAAYERHLPHFAHTLTYSSQAIHDLALNLGFPEERMRHLPVGANVDRFKPQPPSSEVYTRFQLRPDFLTVLYMGQLEGAAHASHLVEAAPLVLQQAPNTQFLFVGGGEQLPALRRQAESSLVNSSLHVAGYVKADAIPSIVATANICVACFDDDDASRAKSPLKIAEYLASGKPIVASRVGDAPWMTEGCGISVQSGSPEALAQGILTYANDSQRRQRDGLTARQRALELFTWERGVETLLETYRLTTENI